MKKGFKYVFMTLLVVALMLGSFLLGNKMAITTGDKVILNKSDFNIYSKTNQMKAVIDKYFLFDVDERKLEDGVYKGLFKGLNDPYSEYLTKEEFDSFKQSTSGEYKGIGIFITVTEDNLIQVVSPIKDSPAFKAGIKPDDIIYSVNGKVYPGDKLNEATAIMKGKDGDEVKLVIKRKNSTGAYDSIDMDLKVEKIKLLTVESKVIDDLGYLHISQFGEHTYKEFTENYEELKSQNVKGIIIDLRNNPGGLKDSCVKIADYLLPEGPIVKTVDKNKKEEVDMSDAKEENIPMVVLINGGSASASEILSGAIKDYKKATIVGENSYGKGIVQTIAPAKSFGIDDNGAIKLTVQEYFTPKDNKIHEIGVKPDIEVKLPDDIINFGPDFIDTDTQLQKAIEILK
ncbi:S41 family peptidase [Mediannikoviicoccus vaginalis]|uniref:S41 family peptidase n=1 Tax=Mediannikoviicoccus vaginalis TaxID=2899727 RepID=UPI001F2D2B20|nr:S41 family peptidase [Mediannikoviicoccus vaginalis]